MFDEAYYLNHASSRPVSMHPYRPVVFLRCIDKQKKEKEQETERALAASDKKSVE